MGILKRAGGLVAIVIGLSIAGWVAWQMYQGDGPRRGVKGIIFGLVMAGVGAGWLFGVVGGDDDAPAAEPDRDDAGRVDA